MKTEKLQLGCSLMLVSGVGQKCAKTSESRRLTSAFPGEQRLSGHLSSFASKNMEYCNTAKQFRTRICICIWLVNFCFKCWLWHIAHMYTRISVITFADFGVLLLEIPVRNTFVEHLCVACHFHLTYPTIFKKNEIIVHLVLRDTPLYCHEFKKCLSTLENVNPNYLFSQFPLILSTFVCFSYI